MEALGMVITEHGQQLGAQAQEPDAWHVTWNGGLAFASTFLSVDGDGDSTCLVGLLCQDCHEKCKS